MPGGVLLDADGDLGDAVDELVGDRGGAERAGEERGGVGADLDGGALEDGVVTLHGEGLGTAHLFPLATGTVTRGVAGFEVTSAETLGAAEDGPTTHPPVIDLAAEVREVTVHWTPRVVGRVNDQYVEVAKPRGELTWHAHDAEDEMFLVVSGRLRLQLRDDQEVAVGPGQFHVVPRGVLHNPVADEEVEIVLIETVTTAHTGDVVMPGTVPVERQVGDFR